MPAPLDRIDWPVLTDRLLLRRAVTADLDAVWAIRSIPGVGEWLSAAPVDRDAFAAWFDEPRRDKTVVAELRDEPGRVVADLMIAVSDAWTQAEIPEGGKDRQAELGWVLHPEFGGRGYATEAVLAALSICFDRLGVHRAIAGCFAANEPSWRLMERVGMRREQAGIRDGLHRSGVWMDGYEYAILADEWAGRGVS